MDAAAAGVLDVRRAEHHVPVGRDAAADVTPELREGTQDHDDCAKYFHMPTIEADDMPTKLNGALARQSIGRGVRTLGLSLCLLCAACTDAGGTPAAPASAGRPAAPARPVVVSSGAPPVGVPTTLPTAPR